MNFNKDLLELNLAVFCISTSGVFGRMMQLSPELIIFYRCLLAGAILGLYIFYRRISYRVKSKKDFWLIVLGGVLMAGHWVTYFYSLKLSNIAIAMLTLHTFPAITSLLEPIILGTQFRKYHLLLALLVICGIYIIMPSIDLQDDIVIASLLGLASAVFYALRNIYTKKVITSYNGSVLMWFQLIIMTILLSPFVFIYDSTLLTIDWPYVILLALVTTSIGHTLLVKNLKHFSAVTVSLISSIIPVYGILFGIFFLQEIPTVTTVVGGLLIMTSFMLETLSTSKK